MTDQGVHMHTSLIDKSTWHRGPWDKEPDRVEWRAEPSGYPCLIVRVEHTGAFCGYVAVASSHPAYGKNYDDLEDISVHGGLTYAAKCQGHVCHKPLRGEPADVWWLGFDCAHAGDQMPAMSAVGLVLHGNYRDLVYVTTEVNDLAAQLWKMAREHPKIIISVDKIV